MRIAAIVVTFHPNINALVDNILTYHEYVDYILIWRNSQEEIKIPESVQAKIIFCGSGRNEYNNFCVLLIT